MVRCHVMLFGGLGSLALVGASEKNETVQFGGRRRRGQPSGACSVGGEDLCGCSELISAQLIASFDDCTQTAAVAACQSGACSHSDSAEKNEALQSPSKLPFSFHDSYAPFDLSWGFPSEDTIEIEYSLPSDFYTGIGFGADGAGDTVAGWIDESGQVHVRDYYDEGSRRPLLDEERGCKNDIEAVSGSYEDGTTTIRFRRKLNTGDAKDCDAVITRGPMDIAYAYCDAPACFGYRNGCAGFDDGCLDIPHGGGAASFVTVDFSGSSNAISV